MGLLGFKNMNSHVLGLIGEEHEERCVERKKTLRVSVLSLAFNWKPL